jgi:hypothetical protein
MNGDQAGNQYMPQLTEAMAAIAFARAWNRLDPTEFIELLAPDARYASQWVFEELVGQDAIADYLIGKMRNAKAYAVNSSEHKVSAELGRTTKGFSGRDCVFMAQGRKESVTAVVLFEVIGERIKRYDLCIPQLLDGARSGVHPI